MPIDLLQRPSAAVSAYAFAPRAPRAVHALGALALAVLAACGSPQKAAEPAAAPPATSTAAAAPARAGAAPSATATAGSPAGSAASSKTPRTGPGLFADLTQPGKGTPKPRTRAAATPAREGKIIPGSVNVYNFDPAESFVPADPSSTSIAQVLADMGPDAIEWYQHVQTLSNPWFEGRVPGSDGIEHAATYVQWWMKKNGLEPAFAQPASAADASAASSSSSSSASAEAPANPWRQPFDLPGREPRVKGGTLSFDGKALESREARPMRNSGGGMMEGPIAFVGYGIEDGKDGYNSFAPDERLEGTVVLVMRGEPLNADGKSLWGGEKFTSASSLAAKFQSLRRRGVNGIIVTEPPGYGGKKIDLTTMSPESLGGLIGVPVFYADTAAVDAIVRKADPEGRDFAALRALADAGTKDAPFRTVRMKDDAKVTLKASMDSGGLVTHNVGGILRGRGSRADEWIVIGAHYDHVGYGMYGADPQNRGQVHPGADDNASGTSGMLVLTRRLVEAYQSAPSDANLRSVLFLAFSAEEVGLNGSRYFVKTPTIAADKVDVMLNMDMIGRMRGNELVVGGVESAKGFSAALEPFFKKSGLTIYADPSGRGPSDHSSFFSASIPVLFFFSGVHDIYHKPGDRGFTVDPRGVPAILDLVQEIAMWRASSADRLEFQNGAPRRQNGDRNGAVAASGDAAAAAAAAPGGSDRGYAPVRLGIQPGLAGDGESGILVESVSEGTSAAEGGIKAGDVMLSWNGDSLGSVQDMMTKLRSSKPGDVAKIRVLRDGKEIVLDVKLKASNAPRRPQND